MSRRTRNAGSLARRLAHALVAWRTTVASGSPGSWHSGLVASGNLIVSMHEGVATIVVDNAPINLMTVPLYLELAETHRSSGARRRGAGRRLAVGRTRSGSSPTSTWPRILEFPTEQAAPPPTELSAYHQMCEQLRPDAQGDDRGDRGSRRRRRERARAQLRHALPLGPTAVFNQPEVPLGHPSPAAPARVRLPRLIGPRPGARGDPRRCDDIDAGDRRAVGWVEPGAADRRAGDVRRPPGGAHRLVPAARRRRRQGERRAAPRPASSSSCSPRPTPSPARSPIPATQAAMTNFLDVAARRRRASAARRRSPASSADCTASAGAAADRRGVGGKPSWSARAIDRRCHAASAAASARATAVRLRNASAVMPDDTWANPLVGSDAGQPITKLAGAERRVLADEDLAGVDERVDARVDLGVGDRDLEVLGCVPVGDVDRLVEVGDEHAAAVRRRATPRAAVGSARRAGRRAARSSSASTASASSADVVTSTTDESVPCSASISRSAASRTGSAVSSAITRLSVGPSSIIVATPWRCISTWAHVTAGDARADDLAHLGDRLGAEPERGDAGRPVDAEHVADAELAAHDEHGGIDRAAAARASAARRARAAARRRRSPARASW